MPKAGGGQYWPEDGQDQRDHVVGYDSSVSMKHDILGELFRRLKDDNLLSDELSKLAPDKIVNKLLYEDGKPVLKSTQTTSLLEFGRIVHAEMAALMDAARLGISVQNATLYTTTFPCHMCARHIVAAGIDRVVYVEPYPKSMAPKLYPDSIAVDRDRPRQKVVSFEPFKGVAPRCYVDLFEMPKRKDAHGQAVVWKEKEAKPRLQQIFPSYMMIEAKLLSALKKQLESLGIKAVGWE